jgi:hypothetical protein
MDKLKWLFGMRYVLSGDGIGLLKYFTPKNYYHIHSDEMTSLEKWKYRALTKLKGNASFN